MGLRSFLNKKKNRGSLSAPSPTPSRSPSLSSRAQIEEELKQVFTKFDANGDGKISSSELASILASLSASASPEEVDAMIKEVDSDGDGCIDLDEFIELNTKGIDSNEAMENLREAFMVFDMDGNGTISAEELQSVMRSIGEECSIAECRRMISGADCDGDGLIDFEEFKVMMIKGSRFDAMEAHRNSVKVE